MNRRLFGKYLALTLGLGFNSLVPALSFDRKPEPAAVSGRPEVERLDRALRNFLNEWDIPCVCITVSYKGKVVLSRGIGMADWESNTYSSTKDIFRIASISKSITAVGILLLYQQGKLDLDMKVFELLKDMHPCSPNLKPDPRIYSMTIRNLLECSSGWNEELRGDPIFGSLLADLSLNCSRSLRPSPKAIIRFMLNERLEFFPGTNYAYSNVSYVVLGEIIEKVSGMDYAEFITQNVLIPMKLEGIRQGATLECNRMPGEVKYYGEKEEKGPSLLPNVRGPLTNPYGAYFIMEACRSTIGWVARTEELVQFVDILSGQSEIPSPLNAKTTAIMFERPKIPHWKDATEFFAKGWEVSTDKSEKQIYFSRHGSLPGSMALLEHQANGISWAACFNFRPTNYVSCREQAVEIIKSGLARLYPYLKAKYDA